MKVNLRNIVGEFIAVVYDEDGVAVHPCFPNSIKYYDLSEDTTYMILCARQTYTYNTKNKKLEKYNYK